MIHFIWVGPYLVEVDALSRPQAIQMIQRIYPADTFEVR